MGWDMGEGWKQRILSTLLQPPSEKGRAAGNEEEVTLQETEVAGLTDTRRWPRRRVGSAHTTPHTQTTRPVLHCGGSQVTILTVLASADMAPSSTIRHETAALSPAPTVSLLH